MREREKLTTWFVIYIEREERERDIYILTTWFVMSLRIASFLRGSIETGITLTAANDNEIHDIVHFKCMCYCIVRIHHMHRYKQDIACYITVQIHYIYT